MKLAMSLLMGLAPTVAPRTGAWIETFPPPDCHFIRTAVAPRTGAWIETWLPSPPRIWRVVAPRTGAWIETAHTRAT